MAKIMLVVGIDIEFPTDMTDNEIGGFGAPALHTKEFEKIIRDGCLEVGAVYTRHEEFVWNGIRGELYDLEAST